MSSMSDRKAELERKKAKLQALREEKDRRRREKEQKDAEEALQRASTVSSLDSHRDLDEMLSSLGVAPVKDVLSSLSSMTSLTPPQPASPDASLPHSERASLTQGVQKKPTSLQVVSVQSTDIPPREQVTYTKQTQTAASGGAEIRDGYMEDWWRPRKAHATDYYDEYNLNPGLEWEDEFTVLTFGDDDAPARQGEDDEASFHGKLPPGILPHGLPTVKEVQPAVTQQEQKKPDEEEKRVARELSADEKHTIMLSGEFQRFMSRAGRLIERALAEDVDIYTDYIGGGGDENAADDKPDAKLSLVRTFYDARWSKGRCVTCLEHSSFHPELLLAAYHNSLDAPHDPDGVCLLWNAKFKKTTPEDVFHCQSPVMSAQFAKFHPNLILGGTYSGQIVLWDTRVQKRTPIQRTPLSSLAHTHPVYCLSVVGSPNAHNLISVSTDGRLCSWTLEMLSAPQDTLELQTRQSKAVAVTAMAFPHGDINNFILGSEDGNVYTGCRHGQRAGVTDGWEAHAGAITAVSAHAAPGADLAHLYLTASVDWSVKLCSLKENKPLYSFEESGDYVTDARWSPLHPALFAAADATGRLALWNLNRDTEVPVATTMADDSALNRVAWAPGGAALCSGDERGRINIYDLNENLSQPRHDEWSRLSATLLELRHARADEESDRLGPPPPALAANPLR